MEDSTDSITNNSEDSQEFMDVTPVIEDFLTSSLMRDNMENPYVDEMIKDELVPSDIDYFCKSFADLTNVKFERIHCTCCNKHLGTAVESTPERYKHPLLKVVQCEKCYLFYCSGDFEKDKDGSELYCRWCGEGGQVFCCSKCPYVFCKKCISRNLGRGTASIIENSDDWLCFNCNTCQISKQRAICWAIMKYAENFKQQAESNPELIAQLKTDYSSCCHSKYKRTRSIIGNKEPLPKKIKIDEKSASLLKNVIMGQHNEKKSKTFDWTIPTEPEDEVICTPDILPFDESPPSSPQPPDLYESPPDLDVESPKQSPIHSAPPKLTPIILARKSTTPQKTVIAQTTIISQRGNTRTIAPKIILPSSVQNKINITAPTQINNLKITPVLNTTNSTKIYTNNLMLNENQKKTPVPVTQKINVPITRPVSIQFEDQWFNTAVVKSADVTEYISSNVTKLASQNNKKLTEQEKIELYKTFQMYIDIAISKLKSIKQNMQFSFNNLRKQPTVHQTVQQTGKKTVQQSVQLTVQQPAQQSSQQPSQESIQQTTEKTEYVTSKPKRAAARKKRISYVESSSSDEWVADDDYNDEDFEIGKKKKKNSTSKNQTVTEVQSIQPTIPQHSQMKVVNPINIIQKTTNDQIILDVIDLVDDNSLDPLDNDANTSNDQNKTIKSFLPITSNIIIDDDNSLSGNEKDDEPVSDVESDISEILPDHLVDSPNSKNQESDNEEHKLNGNKQKNEKLLDNTEGNSLMEEEKNEFSENYIYVRNDKNTKESEFTDKLKNILDEEQEKNELSENNDENIKDGDLKKWKNETNKGVKHDSESKVKSLVEKDKNSLDDEEKNEKFKENEIIKENKSKLNKNSHFSDVTENINFKSVENSIDDNYSDDDSVKNNKDKVDENSDICSKTINEINDVQEKKSSKKNEISKHFMDDIENDDSLNINQRKNRNETDIVYNGAKLNDNSIKVEHENSDEDSISVNADQENSNQCPSSRKSSSPELHDDSSNISESRSEKSKSGHLLESNQENGSVNDVEDNISNRKNVEIKTVSSGVDTMEDFEDILRTNTIPIVKEKPKINFGDEFSKFVNTNISPNSDDEDENEYNNDEDILDKEFDMVSKMYEETEDDDALSLPPQNIVDFDINFKDKRSDNDLDKNIEYVKNKPEASSSECGTSKTALESELNVLRKLAENCISLNSDTLASDSKF